MSSQHQHLTYKNTSNRFETVASRLVKNTYIKQGIGNLKTRENQLNSLLEHRKIPDNGFDDQLITFILDTLSAMDSNNFHSNCGVGEREGRIYSQLVRQRHFNLAHGIGRSGDIAEVQPKAAGSSLIYALTNDLVHDALTIAGVTSMKKCLVLPMATGMSLTLCLLSLKTSISASSTSANNSLISQSQKKYVIWSRIDQKSCFKCILAAGLIPLIVDNIMVPVESTTKENKNDIQMNEINNHSSSSRRDAMTPDKTDRDDTQRRPRYMMGTNISEIERLLELHGSESVLCVLSTTSCFAPRQPDDIVQISKLCHKFQVGHIINNAYGLQCQYICKQINRACFKGRVDAVVQSSDKNFMTPVGGAVVCSPDPEIIQSLSRLYPGRASMTPGLDLFITLLSMGKQGYRELLRERTRLFQKLTERVEDVASKYGEHILLSPRNSISLAVSLEYLHDHGNSLRHDDNITTTTAAAAVVSNNNDNDDSHVDFKTQVSSSNNINPITQTQIPNSNPDPSHLILKQPNHYRSFVTYFGSLLFQRQVSGCRVVYVSNDDEKSTDNETTMINSYHFRNWGSHINSMSNSANTKNISNSNIERVVESSSSNSNSSSSYFTVACAIGMTEKDIDRFIHQLEKCFHKLYKHRDV